MYATVGETPLGPFRVASSEPLLPAGMTDRPYAGRIVVADGRHYLLGTIWSDAGDSIGSDPDRADRDGYQSLHLTPIRRKASRKDVRTKSW
jgi:hypothetical protein